MQLFRRLPVLATDHGEVALKNVALKEVSLPVGVPVFGASALSAPRLVFGAVALGVLAGAIASAYLWKTRMREEILQATPLERVEELIASCESKIEDIERTIANLQSKDAS